jgi:glutathione S-transferase
MENQLPNLPGTLTIAHIAFASVIGYLDFRYPDIGWQTDYPNLADWYGVFSRRPSMQQTVHSDHSFQL